MRQPPMRGLASRQGGGDAGRATGEGLMRAWAVSLCLAAGMCASSAALSAPRIATRTTYYEISGESGAAVLRELDRRGPKHGFMTRAIAQTRYTMSSESDWRHERGACVAVRPSVRLDIAYVFPKLAGKVSPALKQRWQLFFAGVTRHEETHGRIAREMAMAAEKAVRLIRIRDGKGCGRFQGEMKRAIGVVMEEHEKRQNRFDAVEHQKGGNIERLIARLVR